MKERIIQWLAEHEPHSTLLHLAPLHGGISSSMLLFQTASSDGSSRKRILRIPNPETQALNPTAASDEFEILTLVNQAGIPAPTPVFLDPDGTAFNRPAIILEFIEGTVDLNPQDTNAYFADFAQQLASIHAIKPTTPVRKKLRHIRLTVPELDPITQAALDQRFPCTQALEQLKNSLPIQPVHNEGFLHGDLWPGNVLWKNKQLTGIIDWEEPAWGDPLFDLAICRLEFNWLFGKTAADFFTKQYFEQSSTKPQHLPLWDLFACFRAGHQMAHWCTVYPKLDRPDVTESHMESVRCDFAKQALLLL